MGFGCRADPTVDTPSYTWKFKLQIGDYVKDSIYSSYSDVDVMDSIGEKVPNYREVPNIGRVYGWDPRCATFLEVIPEWDTHRRKEFILYVDPLGYFDFSELFNTYPLEKTKDSDYGKYSFSIEYDKFSIGYDEIGTYGIGDMNSLYDCKNYSSNYIHFKL
jgi:hypothetical protein